MGYPIQNGNTTRPLLFLMVQSSDHLTGITGATPTVTLSKNGAAFAAPAGAVTEVGNGWYKLAANATDAGTNGPLLLHATAASADPTDDRFDVVSYNPDDAVRLGLTALPNVASGSAGAIPTTGTGANQINVASGAVTVGTNNDKTGYSLAANQHVIVDSGTVTTLTNLPSIPANWLTAAGIAASALNGKGDWLLASNYTAPLSSSATASAVWDALTSGHAVTGSFGLLVATDLDATVSSRLAASGYTAPLTATQVENAVWNATEASHLTAGTTGAALNAAGSAGDPWATTLPGSYIAGQAGYIVGHNLDAAVSTRMATFIYTAPDNADIAAIAAKLPANSIADETLVINATNAIMAAVGSPMQAGAAVELATSQPNYAPAKAGDAMSLTTAERTAVANALLDLADAIETGITPRTAIKGMVAALFGLTGTAGQNPEVYENPAGTATRLTVANDSSGNRTAVTITP